MEILTFIDGQFQSIRQFMADGGPVLWVLAGIVFWCWVLIIERISYFSFVYPKTRAELMRRWQQRNDHFSWRSRAIREGWLAVAELELRKNLKMIKLLVSVCPMTGLLGTVTGMISVFDIMAVQGSSDPKLMASGISLATFPTLAGMVAALAGMFAHARLVKKSTRLEAELERSLRSQA